MTATSSTNSVCLVLDVGGTNVRLALADRAGSILARRSYACDIGRGAEPFFATLAGEMAELRREAAESGYRVAAVGAGVPGLIARDGLVLSSVNLQPLEGVNFREVLATMSGLPAVVLNDANAAALGEQRFGAGRGFSSLLLFTIGTGVGSGLVLDGSLWLGSDGVAGEYGHMTVEPAGLPCPCGNHGCLEQYASATALVTAARRAIAAGEPSSMQDLDQANLTAADIATAARNADPLARRLFAAAGSYLGIAAATAVNLLNLDAIILTGGVAESFDLLAEELRRGIRERAFAVPAARVQVVKGELGDNAGLLGAAARAWDLLA